MPKQAFGDVMDPRLAKSLANAINARDNEPASIKKVKVVLPEDEVTPEEDIKEIAPVIPVKTKVEPAEKEFLKDQKEDKPVISGMPVHKQVILSYQYPDDFTSVL